MSERELFNAARNLTDPAARAAYLDRACGGDAGAKAKVEALLRAHDQPDSLLDRPAVDPRGPALDATLAIEDEGGEAADDEVALGFLDPATRPDSLGRIGHYEVLQVLGRGAFGIVFRAFDERLHRVVAVKVLSPEMAATSPARKRFLREARSSAQVRHENVVQVYEVGEQPLPYLVMEFILGETLHQRLVRTGPLEVPEVLRIGLQVAEALAAAHANNLIHRDIKPGNVLLESGSQKVKITDFGLARAADDASISQSGIIAGTPMYMAPEQARGGALDQRADLFSLGSVLYQMVAGRPPFRANGTLAVLKRVVEDTPRPIREIIPETPQWLCDIISRLHAKNPDDRFQSAREVADLLGHCLAEIQRPGPNLSLSKLQPAPAAPDLADAAPAARRPRARARRWASAAVFMTLCGGLSLAEATGVTDVRGTVVRLLSPEGTLIVEVDDPGVNVKIEGSDVLITGAGPGEIRLKPGRYTVEGVKDGKVVAQDLVTVTRNGKRVVRVSQEAMPSAPNRPSRESGEETAAVSPAGATAGAGPRAEGVVATTAEADRRTAEYVLSVLHGAVSINSSGHDWIREVAALPRKPWRLSGVELRKIWNLTDAHLTILNGCKDVTLLSIVDSPVSDAGLAHLEGCPSLRELWLVRTSVMDAGLAQLKDCPNLSTLYLDMPKGVGPGLVQLKDCRNLTDLSILGPVSDAGLANLKDWRTVTGFSLGFSKVSDAGLAYLEGWENLSRLHVESTPITDAGLAHLAGLKKLTTLQISGTRVTAIGIGALQQALPKCKIEWDGATAPN